MPERTYSREEIAAAMRRAGFPEAEIAKGVAIALAESGGRAGAVNDTRNVSATELARRGHSAEFSVGPWQINLAVHPLDPTQANDLEQSTKYAYKLWKERGWQPWGAFTDGRWQQFYSGGGAASGGGGQKVMPRPEDGNGLRPNGGTDLPPWLKKKPKVVTDKDGNSSWAITPVTGGFLVDYEDGTSGLVSNTEVFGDRVPADEQQRIQLGYAQLNQRISEAGLDQQNELARLGLNRDQLAENARQFNETLGYNKAVHQENLWENRRQADQGTLGQNADRDVHRGDTLLGLGSRPDTLLRYLYGLGGQQTPQGVFDRTELLPGYGPNAMNPEPLPGDYKGWVPGQEVRNWNTGQGGSGLLPGGGAVGGGTIGGVGKLLPVKEEPFKFNPKFGPTPPVTTPNPAVSMLPPATAPAGIPQGAPIAMHQAPAVAGGAQQAISLANGMSPEEFARRLARYDEGGRIPEPVIGVGLLSGQPYSFGEEGPETVVPAKKGDKVPKKKRGVNSRASGGLIGTDRIFGRDLMGSSGALSPLQPRNLPGLVNNPLLPGGVPNFPQISHFTGGGQSLIPSAEKFRQSTPTERSFYQGALMDVFGVPADDIFDLAQRLAPKSGSVRTPRYGR